jgi:hypothetical protein
MNNYLFVCSRETRNLAKSKSLIGFFDHTGALNNEFKVMQKGGRIFFYVTKEKIIDGFAIIKKEMFWDDQILYKHMDELCARRIGVEVIDTKLIDFMSLVPKLSFIKKKKGVVWSAYLVRNLIRLNEKDAEILEDSL